jgi:hypothetical protein
MKDEFTNPLPKLVFDKKRTRVKFCPCGKSNKDVKFAPFVGYEDKGFCHSCGLTFLPELPGVENWRNLSFNKPIPVIKSKQEIEIIPMYILDEILIKYKHWDNDNHFIQWLGSEKRKEMDQVPFDNELVKSLIERYRLGNYGNCGNQYNGWTLFPYIDIQGRVRQMKIMDYNAETGKRVKEPQNKVLCVGKIILKNTEANIVACFYGEHLLAGNSKSVRLFESEATATYAAAFFPDSICLATGGTHGAKWVEPDVFKVLRGRKITLYPDIDTHELWEEKAMVLRDYNLDVIVSQIIVQKALSYSKSKGISYSELVKQKYDLRDFLKYQCNTNFVPSKNDFVINVPIHTTQPMERNLKLQIYDTAVDCNSFERITLQGESDKTAHVKPTKFDVAIEFVTVKIADLSTSLKDFQVRKQKYSIRTYNRIIRETQDGVLNRSSIPPIQIWMNLETGKWIILAGHSRVAAFSDLNDGVHGGEFKGKYEYIKAQIVDAKTLDEAKKVAKESNSGAPHTELENAIYVRDTILPLYADKPFATLLKKLDDIFGENYRRILAFAHLNPEGKPWQAMENFEGSQAGENKGKLKQAAKWIGEERMKHEQLTNAHEGEMYDFLITKSSMKDLKQTMFAQRVGSLLGKRDFNAEAPLNLARIKNKNTGEQEYDNQHAEIKAQLANKTKQLRDLNAQIVNTKLLQQQSIDTDNPINTYNEMLKLADAKIADLEKEIAAIKRKKRIFETRKRAMIIAGYGQKNLFTPEDKESTASFKSITTEAANLLGSKKSWPVQ